MYWGPRVIAYVRTTSLRPSMINIDESPVADVHGIKSRGRDQGRDTSSSRVELFSSSCILLVILVHKLEQSTLSFLLMSMGSW